VLVATRKSVERAQEIERVTTVGPGRQRLTRQQVERRNELLVEDSLRGASEAALAERYKITDRMVRIVMSEWRNAEKPTMAGRNPIEIVWEAVDRYQAWIAQLADVAADGKTQDSVRVGAINAQVSTQDKLLDLLQKSGILPRDLGELRIQADVMFLSRQLVEVFERHNVSSDVTKDVLNVLGASQRQQG
jgi:hypothetical protein